MAGQVFANLFSPVRIGDVVLRNRIAISAHFAGWWVSEGLPNEDFAAYIEERARGGAGLFVIGATVPTFDGGPTWIQNTSEAIVPRYRMLAESGHRHGMKVFAQLIHTRDPMPSDGQDRIRAGMSAGVAREQRRPARRPDRSAAEVRELCRRFGEAAERAKRGGVDGLELHAHEGFLHAQFLSPICNRRMDEYGGSLANRMRFIAETLEAMRGAIGRGMPLGIRLKAHDQEAGGMTTSDYIELVARLEKLGLVDYISLTAGDGALHHGPMPRPDGEWLPFVRQIKRETALPVMHAGRITTPQMAEQAIAEGMADVICMTKAQIADPHFARKVREGRLEEIRYCTRCLQNCIGDYEHMTCIYNPQVGRERLWAQTPAAERRKRVVIIGAGPAGMEAAIAASGRGHEVIVVEKSERLGGQALLAAASPMRRMFGRIAEFYERQATRGAFEVRRGVEAGRDLILGLEPEAVIVATGSRPIRAAIPGGREAWTVSKSLRRDLSGLRKAIVVDRTGTMHALMAADRLSDRGIEVQYLTPAQRVADHIDGMTREEMLGRLEGRGVRFEAAGDVAFWDREAAVVRSNLDVEERAIRGVDAVVVSAGAAPVNGLTPELWGAVAEVYTIGDANEPRSVAEATVQGALVGRKV